MEADAFLKIQDVIMENVIIILDAVSMRNAKIVKLREKLEIKRWIRKHAREHMRKRKMRKRKMRRRKMPNGHEKYNDMIIAFVKCVDGF